jgi:hypothetical protein
MQLRHAMSRRSRCHTARLEHHDASVTKPGGVEHGERNQRRLSGARGSLKHCSSLLRERRMERRNDFGDGEPQRYFPAGAVIAHG